LLRPEEFDQHRVPGLDAFAQPARRRAAALPEEQVLGQLLADRAAATQPAATFVAFARLLDRIEVEAPMVGEVLVLGRDQCDRHRRRDRIQVPPVVGDAERPVAFDPRLDLADGHERGKPRIDHAHRQHLAGGHRDEKHRQQCDPAQPATPPADRRAPPPDLRSHCSAPIDWPRRHSGIIRHVASPFRHGPHDMTLPDDALNRFLLPEAGVRGVHVRLHDTWREIGARGDYPANIRELLGEAVAAAALFTGHAKIEGRLSVQLRGEAALRTLFAECTAEGAAAGDSRDLRELAPGATLAITIENPALSGGDPVRYQGLVPLESDALSGAFEDYFRQSEQLPTRILLAATGDQAAGLMLQKLPGDSDRDHDGWTRASALFDTLGSDELLGLPFDALLHRLFHEEQPQSLGDRPLHFACSCSRERVSAMLQALGQDEALAAVID